MALERELEAFRKARPELLAQGKDGEFALVYGDQVAGTYGTYELALEAGYEKFELEPFFVKKVEAIEQVKVVTRHIRPCPT